MFYVLCLVLLAIIMYILSILVFLLYIYIITSWYLYVHNSYLHIIHHIIFNSLYYTFFIILYLFIFSFIYFQMTGNFSKKLMGSNTSLVQPHRHRRCILSSTLLPLPLYFSSLLLSFLSFFLFSCFESIIDTDKSQELYFNPLFLYCITLLFGSIGTPHPLFFLTPYHHSLLFFCNFILFQIKV